MPRERRRRPSSLADGFRGPGPAEQKVDDGPGARRGRWRRTGSPPTGQREVVVVVFIVVVFVVVVVTVVIAVVHSVDALLQRHVPSSRPQQRRNLRGHRMGSHVQTLCQVSDIVVFIIILYTHNRLLYGFSEGQVPNISLHLRLVGVWFGMELIMRPGHVYYIMSSSFC